jgi:hypothetical protein
MLFCTYCTGEAKQLAVAQKEFMKRAKANSEATLGKCTILPPSCRLRPANVTRTGQYADRAPAGMAASESLHVANYRY